MRRFSLYSVLMLPTLAASLLATACIADTTPTPFLTAMPLPTPTTQSSTHGDAILVPNPAARIYLVYNLFMPDQPISTTAELTRFLPDEEIDVTLTASDGSQAPLGTATADDSGMASVDIRHDVLAEGTYTVTAIGDSGSRASATLFVSASISLAGVHLLRNNFSADLPISTIAVLTGFEPGESIEVTLIASDGSTSPLGSATANGDGIADVDIRHDGLAAGAYLIEALGDGGGKASHALFIK